MSWMVVVGTVSFPHQDRGVGLGEYRIVPSAMFILLSIGMRGRHASILPGKPSGRSWILRRIASCVGLPVQKKPGPALG